MTSVSVLKGNIGQDPELRTTTSGIKVATYSLAVYRANPKEKDKPITDWFNVVAWGDQAEQAVKHLKKGSKVLVVGKFQTRSYESKEGKKVTLTEFFQEEFGIIPKKEETSEDTGSFTWKNEEMPF